MSTLKELYGKTVKVLSTDPTDAGAEGQVWYNSTEGAFKTVLNAGSWSAGGNLATARTLGGGSGTSSAAMIAGGSTPGNTAVSEEFTGETVSANIKTFTTS